MVAPGDKKALGRFCVLGLLGLLLLNASFNGWYGGLCPGPRYLCAIFPVWALFLGLAWDGLADSRRRALTVGLALSGVLAVLVFCTNLAVPLTPIWPYLAHQTAATTATAKIRFGVLLVVTVMALVWQKRHRQLEW